MLMAVDPALFQWLNAGPGSPAGYIRAARLVSDWLPVAGGLAVLLGLWQQGTAGRQRLACVAGAAALAWLSARLIRWGFPQPRPAHYGMGVQWIAHAVTPSLPSMHATVAFAVAQALHLCLPKPMPSARAALWLGAALIALSRVVLGVHFPTDIAAGALLGSLAAWLTWRLWRVWLIWCGGQVRHPQRTTLPS